MPEVKALKCASCGAPLEAEKGQTRIKCPFCGTVNMIEPEPGEAEIPSITIDLSELVETAMAEAEKAPRPVPPPAGLKAAGITAVIILLLLILIPVGLSIGIPLLIKKAGSYSLRQAGIKGDKMVAVLYKDSKYHLGRVNPKNGKIIWRKELGKEYSITSIAIGDERVYTASGDGSLSCYDLDNGSLLWEANTRAYVYLNNLVPLGNGVCFLGNDDTIRFFNADGKQTLSRCYKTYCLPRAQGERIYLAQDSLLSAINPENGKAVFTTRLGFDPRYMCLDPSGIYVLGNAYWQSKTCLVKLDLKTGSVLWENAYPETYAYDSLLALGKTLYLFDDSLASVSSASGQRLGNFYDEAWEPTRVIPGDDNTYIVLRRSRGVTGFRLVSADPGSLATTWREDLKDTLVVFGDGAFIIDTASDGAIVRKLDGKTGKELWKKKIELKGYIWDAFLAGGNLIIEGSGATLAIRTKDGKKAWKGIR
ncbi:MAG: PQQ-binding-like beta-propeller repeat protein [candidate division WOR-3 bacterium]